MTAIIPFAAPHIDDEEINAVSAVLRSGWIGTGEVTSTAEREFADYLGTPNTLLLNSGTAALHLAMLSHDIGPGAEVIVPTVTFTATAAAVVHAGAQPVLVDVEPGTLTIDVEAVRRALTARTRAVVAVHFAGRMADVRALRELCDDHSLVLIEDSAHALPAERDGAGPGQLGDAAAFSFFVTKPLTSAEGGLLVTRTVEAIESAKVLSAHGIRRGAFERHTFGRSPHYDIVAAGWKYNLPDTAAALLRCQLARADWMRDRRRAIARTYLDAFAGVPGLGLPPADTESSTSSWYLFPIQLPAGLDRDLVAGELARLGIGTSVHFRPLHHFSYYRQALPEAAQAFPVADAAFPRLLSLPIYPAMTDEDTHAVVDVVRKVLAVETV